MMRRNFAGRSLLGRALLLAFTLLLAVVRSAEATEQGTLIHFPAKLTDDWAPAEAAAREAAGALGKGAWLRFDNLWHEQNFEPFAPAGHARMEKIVALCKREGFKPLMNVIPHPWPTSAWTAPWKPKRDWGDPDPEMFPWIARRYAETVTAYRAALKANGIAEIDAAIQFGNEPAAGHPGGNGTLPPGTWSASAVWTACNAVADYGQLNVIAPALSMQDQPDEVAARERKTALIDAKNWTAPVTAFALHNRVYRADLAGEGYADEYLKLLTARAKAVNQLGWPKGDAAHQKKRAAGLWVTEGYVAVGDAGGDRAQAVAAVARRIKAGVPGVAVFIWYRWYPAAPEGQVQWQFDDASKAALRSVATPKSGTASDRPAR